MLKSNSKSLNRKKEKRLEVLDYLIKNLNFFVYLLVIAKAKLDNVKGALRFGEVFYKYFQKIFVSIVVRLKSL